MKTKWVIQKDKTKDHWLEVNGYEGSAVINPDHTETPLYSYQAICKWDGCVHFYQGLEDDDVNEPEYIHICDLDQMIEALQELKKTGVKFFKDKSGEEYWQDNTIRGSKRGNK